jgi:hypothetical protein
MALVLPGVVCSCKSTASIVPNVNSAIHAWPAGPTGSMTIKNGAALWASCYSGPVLSGQMSCVNGAIVGTPYVCPSTCAVTGVKNGIKYAQGLGTFGRPVTYGSCLRLR